MAETAEYIGRGQELLADQPKVVIMVGENLDLTVIEGAEHITKEELDDLAEVLRKVGIEGPIDEPVEILLSTTVENGGLYDHQPMRDAICSQIATSNTLTGLDSELLRPDFKGIAGIPLIVVEGLWVPPSQELARLALNHPWAAYEESQRGMTF